MAIKHAKATHYKENIETKTKKLNDTSVTTEQKKVIQQDLDKLKEKHENHVKAIEKDFNEQIKAAPEMKKELEKEKEAFKSKYVVKEVKKTDDKNGESQNINTDVQDKKTDDKNVGSQNNKTDDKNGESQNINTDVQNNKTDDKNGESQNINTDVQDKKTDDKNGESQNINTDVQDKKTDDKNIGSQNNKTDDKNIGSQNNKTDDNSGAIKEENVEKIKEAILDAIKNGKYYGFKNLTVQKFAEAKNIDIKNLSLDNQTVFDFYGGNKEYKWIDKFDKTTKCKKAICEKITEIKNISEVISYDILSINKNYNSDCYNDGKDRVTFDTGTTIMDYWEKVCLELLSEEAVM